MHQIRDPTQHTNLPLIKELDWDTLEKRRQQIKTTMAYKIINNLVILPPTLLPKVTPRRPTRKCQEATVGTEQLLVEPISRLDITVPRLWNSMVTPPESNAPSVEAFRNN